MYLLKRREYKQIPICYERSFIVCGCQSRKMYRILPEFKTNSKQFQHDSSLGDPESDVWVNFQRKQHEIGSLRCNFFFRLCRTKSKLKRNIDAVWLEIDGIPLKTCSLVCSRCLLPKKLLKFSENMFTCNLTIETSRKCIFMFCKAFSCK